MHFCTCSIRIDGDMRTVVPRDIFCPVSYPEIDVLRHIHGEDAVLDVKPFISVEQTTKDEKFRLGLKYGGEVLEIVYPGRNPSMTMEVPNARLPAPPAKWFNPLDPEPAGYDVKPEDREHAVKAEAKTEPAKARVLKDF